MKYLKKYKNDKYNIPIVFTESGEIIYVNEEEFEALNDYIIIDYNEDIQFYIIPYELKHIVDFVLGETEY